MQNTGHALLCTLLESVRQPAECSATIKMTGNVEVAFRRVDFHVDRFWGEVPLSGISPPIWEKPRVQQERRMALILFVSIH